MDANIDSVFILGGVHVMQRAGCQVVRSKLFQAQDVGLRVGNDGSLSGETDEEKVRTRYCGVRMIRLQASQVDKLLTDEGYYPKWILEQFKW
eukprot:756215-Hanusia_phi.AAC.9